uniref:Zinc finger CHCC-type domain-containing protein n=1 Tax=Plectus sambesii TaxID=2011161 RepID=A0A914XR43_9BILA
MASRALQLTLVRQRTTIVRSLASSAKSDSQIAPFPKPSTTPANQLQFDKVTHTGQAWDKEDYRLARFERAPKQVNPNIAMHLIAEQPPKGCEENVVWCDGGHAALGHPRVYINLDKPGNHACGYCGLRYYNLHVHQDGTEHNSA